MPNFGSMLAGLKKGGQWLGAEDQAGLRGAIGGAVGGQSGWGSNLGQAIGGKLPKGQMTAEELERRKRNMPQTLEEAQRRGQLPTHVNAPTDMGLERPDLDLSEERMGNLDALADMGMGGVDAGTYRRQPQQQANPFGKKGM